MVTVNITFCILPSATQKVSQKVSPKPRKEARDHIWVWRNPLLLNDLQKVGAKGFEPSTSASRKHLQNTPKSLFFPGFTPFYPHFQLLQAVAKKRLLLRGDAVVGCSKSGNYRICFQAEKVTKWAAKKYRTCDSGRGRVYIIKMTNAILFSQIEASVLRSVTHWRLMMWPLGLWSNQRIVNHNHINDRYAIS